MESFSGSFAERVHWHELIWLKHVRFRHPTQYFRVRELTCSKATHSTFTKTHTYTHTYPECQSEREKERNSVDVCVCFALTFNPNYIRKIRTRTLKYAYNCWGFKIYGLLDPPRHTYVPKRNERKKKTQTNLCTSNKLLRKHMALVHNITTSYIYTNDIFIHSTFLSGARG